MPCITLGKSLYLVSSPIKWAFLVSRHTVGSEKPKLGRLWDGKESKIGVPKEMEGLAF